MNHYDRHILGGVMHEYDRDRRFRRLALLVSWAAVGVFAWVVWSAVEALR